MGVIVPNFASSTEDRTSGAQVIDGSLRFDDDETQYLRKAFTTEGNRRTFTWSCWLKLASFGDWRRIFTCEPAGSNIAGLAFRGDGNIDGIRVQQQDSSNNNHFTTSAVYRDNAWYHVVMAVDTTIASPSSDRIKVYVNGELQSGSYTTGAEPAQDSTWFYNSTSNYHEIGRSTSHAALFDGHMTQCYWIDGLALGPENFGYTDPLTNTWRPKKYTGDFNISSSDYTGVFAPYSAISRWNSFKTYTTVNENATSYTLPMSNPSHYGGKALDLASGGFQVQTNNSAAGDFFMAIWVNLDAYETSKQMGVDIAGNYVYFETQSSGAIKIRHTGSGGQTSNTGYANGTNQWQHWALSRSGGSLRAFVNGQEIVTDTGGISGNNTVLANSKFNFFGADNNTTSYNINGQVIDAVIYIGQGVSGNFTPPTAPLIDSSGNINHYSGFSDSQLYFASPLVDVSGSDPNSATDYITTGTNSFYLPMDGNTPIGKDQSGNGNDWTPVNFGGSNSIEKATGARPILNTANGGNIAAPGVFGSKVSKTLTTTASTNTSNGFVFANEGTKPTLSFVRGATYTFDYSASTGHPLRFATAADAAGSTEYTDGTDTSVANTVKITVPHNAPDTLYYYCTNHGGMGNSISVTTDEKVADPYAWKCVFAVPTLSDVSGDLNATVSSKTVTNNNSVSNSNISNFYTSGAYVKGSNRHLSTANNSDFNLGSDDFTWEMWVYPTASGNTILSRWGETGQTTASWAITNGGDVYLSSNGSSITQISFTAASQNKWTHLAVVRSGSDSNNIKIYKDGILSTTGTFTGSLYQNNLGVLVGNYSAPNNTGTYAFDGYIQDVRVYKGVAKYTSNFIPASTNPDILPDTPSGVAGGSALTKITDGADGAVSFDKINDFLSIPTNTDFAIDSGDYTAECWVYPQSTGEIIGAFNLNANYKGWLWSTEFSSAAGRQAIFISDDTSYNTYYSDTAVPQNQWSHIAFSKSGTTWKFWLNGVLDGSFSDSINPANSEQQIHIGADSNSTTSPTRLYRGFISNLRVIKGTALYTSGFTPPIAPLTNVTNTKLLCCQSNTSAVAAAVTPGSITANGNAAASNFSPFITTDINTVRGQETGYATLNPFSKHSDIILSNGNLTFTNASSAGWRSGGSIGHGRPSSGKYYFETQLTTDLAAGSYNHFVGVLIQDNYELIGGDFGNNANGYCVGAYTGSFRTRNNGVYGPSVTKTTTTGTILQVAIDVDNGRLWFGCDNVWASGSPHSNTSPSYTFTAGTPFSPHFAVFGANASMDVNFGQKPFNFLPPDGFQPLNASTVRPSTVIARPDQYVGVTTYTGNGTSQTITGLEHKPDFVWIKNRDETINNALYDSVRGNTKVVFSNSPEGEATVADFTSFNSDGFTVAYANRQETNKNNIDYVAWTWKAGGNKNTFNIDDVGYASAAAAGLDGGTITPTGASVGTKQGFSIIKYQGNSTAGANISHGLLEAPKLMIHKSLDQSRNWYTITTAIDGSADYLYLNLTNEANDSAVTAPTSDLMYFTSSAESNNNNENYIVYMWHDVPGLQKFGKYTGSGISDGPFIELGFRPAIVLIKKSSATGSARGWVLVDSERSKFNVSNLTLFPHANALEDAGTYIAADFLSNGFKLRSTEEAANQAYTYIYAAWAEAPTFNLYGGQANAR